MSIHVMETPISPQTMTTPDPHRKPSGHSTGDPRLNTIVCPDAMPPSPASEGEDIPKQPGHEESSAKRKRQDGHSQNPNRTHGEASKKLRSEDNGESMVEAFQNFQNFQKAIMGGTKAAVNEDFAQKLSEETYELKKYIKKREFNLVDKMGSKLAPIVTDVASMKITVATQEEHVSALLGDFTELKTDVTKLEEDVTDLKGDHSLFTQAITNNNKSLVTHEDRLNGLSNHEDRLNILSNTTATMKFDLKINQKACTAIGYKLDTEVKDLKSCIEVSKETAKDLEKQLDIVKADVAQLKTGERQRLDNVKTTLNKTLSQAEETHKSAFAQMEEKYKSAMDNLRSGLRAQLEETASLKTTLSEAKYKHNEDLASLRSDMAKLIEDAKRDIRSEQSIEQAKLEQTQRELREFRAAQETQKSIAATEASEALRSAVGTQIQGLTGRVNTFEQTKETASQNQQPLPSSIEMRVENLEAHEKQIAVNVANNNRRIDNVVKQQDKIDVAISSSIQKEVLKDLEATIDGKIEKACSAATKSVTQECKSLFHTANQTCYDRIDGVNGRIDGVNTRIAQLEDTEVHYVVSRSKTHAYPSTPVPTPPTAQRLQLETPNANTPPPHAASGQPTPPYSPAQAYPAQLPQRPEAGSGNVNTHVHAPPRWPRSA